MLCSAARTRSPAVSPGAAMAAPTESRTGPIWLARPYAGAPTSVSMRCANSSTESTSALSRQAIMKVSPPSRAVSDPPASEPAARRRRLATWRSSVSPVRAPSSRFTALKLSMSHTHTAGRRPREISRSRTRSAPSRESIPVSWSLASCVPERQIASESTAASRIANARKVNPGPGDWLASAAAPVKKAGSTQARIATAIVSRQPTATGTQSW